MKLKRTWYLAKVTVTQKGTHTSLVAGPFWLERTAIRYAFDRNMLIQYRDSFYTAVKQVKP